MMRMWIFGLGSRDFDHSRVMQGPTFKTLNQTVNHCVIFFSCLAVDITMLACQTRSCSLVAINPSKSCFLVMNDHWAVAQQTSESFQMISNYMYFKVRVYAYTYFSGQVFYSRQAGGQHNLLTCRLPSPEGLVESVDYVTQQRSHGRLTLYFCRLQELLHIMYCSRFM